MPHPQKVMDHTGLRISYIQDWLNILEPIYIFCKELSVDENNIFTADITERHEVENVRFKKLQEYAVTGLSINQDNWFCFSNSNWR